MRLYDCELGYLLQSYMNHFKLAFLRKSIKEGPLLRILLDKNVHFLEFLRRMIKKSHI